MNNAVRIKLLPLGKVLTVERGAALQDILFAHGVEFPCGGRGLCKGCKVKETAGTLRITEDDARNFSARELAEGWRLACCGNATDNLTIDLAQWDAAILADNSTFEFEPQEGLGVAVDLGTTTLVCQLLDMRSGTVLGVQSAFNAQAAHGADIMSRIEFARSGGAGLLAKKIRDQVGGLIANLVCNASAETSAKLPPLKSIVIVGNTVMHNLFCGIDVEPLSRHPFKPVNDGLQLFRAGELGWELDGNPLTRFLPCLGSFVGSDLLAGILATKMHESQQPIALIDLGTNGEILLGNRDKILCASTAAGPAFEGGGINMGMRAATGAISGVQMENGVLRCQVLGNVRPRGICGSGLVDAVAMGLDSGQILPNGRFTAPGDWMLEPPVTLTQRDVREFQLAKGAISAGLRILAQQWPFPLEKIERAYLAGAFGNYVRHASARRIGLINFPPEKIHSSGNTALLGCKMALLSQGNDEAYAGLRAKCRHVPLNEDARFLEIYAEEMQFPALRA